MKVGCIETGPIYDVYYISHCQCQCYLNIFVWGEVSVEQLAASMYCVVLGGVVEVVGFNLANSEIYSAFFSSVDLLYPSVFI